MLNVLRRLSPQRSRARARASTWLIVVWLGAGSALAQPTQAPAAGAWRGLSAPTAPEERAAASSTAGPEQVSTAPAPTPQPVPTPQPAPVPLQTPAASPTTQQDAVRLSPPPPPQAGAAARPTSADDTPHDEQDEHNPMAWLGMSIKLGVANVNSGNLENPTYNQALATYASTLPPEALAGTGLVGTGACTPIDKKCRTPSRVGFQLALTIHVGGDGFGWDAEPYVTIGDEAIATGVYTGPKFDIHVADPVYLGFGFGFKAAYVSLDGWLHGGDIFGRIPVHAIYYLSDNFALSLEGSFGAGVSLFASEPVTVTDPRNGKKLASTPKIAVGAARGWDLTLGVRFP